jgi:hypothetical protein
VSRGSSSGGSSKVLNNFRESVIKQMTKAIHLCAPTLEAAAVSAKVAEIEKAMYKCFNKQTGTPYKRKYKTLLFNFSDNKELVEQIFAGNLSSFDLVRKSVAELANSDLARERELKKQDAFNQHVVESTAIEMVISNEKDADRRIDLPTGNESMRSRRSPSPEREIAPTTGSISNPTSPTITGAPTSLDVGGDGGGSGAASDPDDDYEFKELLEQEEDESTTPPGSPSYAPAFDPTRIIGETKTSAADAAALSKKIAAKRDNLPAWQGTVKNSGTTVRDTCSSWSCLSHHHVFLCVNESPLSCHRSGEVGGVKAPRRIQSALQ